MKLLAITTALAIIGSSVLAEESEGLYIPLRDIEPTYELGDGEIVMRLDAERLILTQAIFRYDTEDETKFWLELDFTKMADPGDFYIFKIDGKTYRGFTVRGQGTNEGGGRWALGFTDPKLGRELLQKIAKIYELPESQMIDKTDGEQGDDAN